MQEQGLIRGNQYAMWLGPIGYHDYEGLLSTDEEGQRLAKNFGNSQIVLQRGHGFVLWGHTIHEAYMLAFLLIRACETQVRSMAGGLKPYVPPQHVLDATIGQARHHHRRQCAVQSNDLAGAAAQTRSRSARLQDLKPSRPG